MELNGLLLERANSSAIQNNIRSASNDFDNAKNDSKKLKKVADDFEAMFVKMALDSMKKTIDEKKNPFYGGLSEDIFSGMLYDEYASLIAKQSDFGFSDAIMQQYQQYT